MKKQVLSILVLSILAILVTVPLIMHVAKEMVAAEFGDGTEDIAEDVAEKQGVSAFAADTLENVAEPTDEMQVAEGSVAETQAVDELVAETQTMRRLEGGHEANVRNEEPVKTRTMLVELPITAKWQPLKVCVMDFTAIDTEGQKRFLDINNKPIVFPVQNTLNDEDHKAMTVVMQGFVRIIDTWDEMRTNEANCDVQKGDTLFMKEKILAVYKKTVNKGARPVVIGAEYLKASLGACSDMFACLSRDMIGKAMMKISQEEDFPQDFMLKVAKATGATHLITGTVTDIRTNQEKFKGYGLDVKVVAYELDVHIKVVDLVAQQSVYSKVYTGLYREQRPVPNAQFDNNIFQKLMRTALQQAAEDLYEKCKSGDGNLFRTTPLSVMESGDGKQLRRSALLPPVIKAPNAPASLAEDMAVNMEECLLQGGIQIQKLKSVTKILAKNGLDSLTELEPKMFVKVGELLEVEMLLQPTVTKFEMQAFPFFMEETGLRGTNYAGAIDGYLRVISAQQGNVVASIPIELKVDFRQLGRQATLNWTVADYHKYMLKTTIVQILPALSQSLQIKVTALN